MPAPLFPHSPIGALTSFSLGNGLAIQIDATAPGVPNADLLVAVTRGDKTIALPFVQSPDPYPGWEFTAVSRSLTACISEYAAPGIVLRIFTPNAALPNPKRSGNLQFAGAPGLLLELAVDNQSDAPVTAFVGIHSLRAGQLRPLDWTSKTLVGIAHSGRWLLAANPVKGEIATLQSPHLHLPSVTPHVDAASNVGGILIQVPPRTAKTIPLAFASYVQGNVTQGNSIDARYFYATYFPRLETVANFLLQNAQRIREACTSFDTRAAAACPDPSMRTLFAHAVRAYNAATQVVDCATPAGPVAYFTALSPQGARNSLLHIANHLPWELFRNPWVIRNVFDLATSGYSGQDQLLFPGDAESPQEPRTGGMILAENFGHASTYAPSSTGGPPAPPIHSCCTSEVLLNAVYMLTSYALTADDTPWARTRLPFARELMVALENRDHWDPGKRTGILKAVSTAAGGAAEQTIFAGVPGASAELAAARGNLYLAIKTFCANLLLTTYYQNNNDLHSADFSYAFAQKTAASLLAAFSPQTQSFPANLLDPATGNSLMLAALEPLALPTFLGLTSTLPEYFPELYAALKSHALKCLQPAPAGCLDGTRLRLSSASGAGDAATVVSVLFVLERLFQIAPPAGVWESLAADPDARAITSALFIKPNG